MNQDLEYLRQLHEPFLADLEGLAVEAIASGNWEPVYQCIGEFNGSISTWKPEDWAEAKTFIQDLLKQAEEKDERFFTQSRPLGQTSSALRNDTDPSGT